MTYKTGDFDEEFFEVNQYGDHKQDDRDEPFRLEDLSAEDANNPTGRGSETAAQRGYDAERVACIIYNGERVNASWFDVQYDSITHNLLESKICISEYKDGQTGRFKIWKKHHEKLLAADYYYPFTCTAYFFLIYTIFEGTHREIGKLRVSPVIIESLIGNWYLEDHDSMGLEYKKELKWTRLVSALGLDIDIFRRRLTVGASHESDRSYRLRSQADYDTRRKNPFEDIEDPYPVCGPSCDIHTNHDEISETV